MSALSLLLLACTGVIFSSSVFAAPSLEDVRRHLSATVPSVYRVVRLDQKIYPSPQQPGTGRISVAYSLQLVENLYRTVNAAQTLNNDLAAQGLPKATASLFLPREVRDRMRGVSRNFYVHELMERKGSKYDYTTDIFYREGVKGFDFTGSKQVSIVGFGAADALPGSIERNSPAYQKMITDAKSAWKLFESRLADEKRQMEALLAASGRVFIYQATNRKGLVEDVFRLKFLSSIVWTGTPSCGALISGTPAVRTCYETKAEITWAKDTRWDNSRFKQNETTSIMVAGFISAELQNDKWARSLVISLPDQYRPGRFYNTGRGFEWSGVEFQLRRFGDGVEGRLFPSQ